MNLFARYADLKKKIGGNRERHEFEFTIGTSAEERIGVTLPSACIRRILAELHFALLLSQNRDTYCEHELIAALEVLEDCMQREQTLTLSACIEAEKRLEPFASAAKEYEVLYSAHAHIDMNWMWGWQETVAITLSTFRTILNLMNEYPDFTYSQSQASVYKIVEEYAPSMIPEIQRRIREGRWEVIANAWVETDKNMPDTESLIRHIGLTRNYLHRVWGIAPDQVKVDFSPDTFGHSRFVPEIDAFGSVPYYYHCRGFQDDLTLYRFRAPSGSEVLTYKEPYWYNNNVGPENCVGVFEMERRCYGLKTALIVYGVGNHGGGPTRRDVEAILDMQQWPVFPTVRFGTLHEFFAKAETVRDRTPVVEHELNVIFSGCFTTQSRIKMANRRTEAALLDSERASALAHCVLHSDYPAQRYEAAWQKTLFTHFHDIITGSCVQESREFVMGKLAEALACAQTEQSAAFEALSQAVDTSGFSFDTQIGATRSEGAGAGFGIANYAGVPNPDRGTGKTRVYTVFNMSAMHRHELVELTVWDYSGDIDALEVVDHEGTAIPFQRLDKSPVRYWDHQYVRLAVQADVPSMGYATYAVREREITSYPVFLMESEREEAPCGPIILENEHMRAVFDAGNGMLRSLKDLKSGEELLGAPASLYDIRAEETGASAWRIGRYLGMEPVIQTDKVHIETGNLRSSVTFQQRVRHSTVQLTASLDAGVDALRLHIEADWHETCKDQTDVPVLTYRLPLKRDAHEILADVPAGIAVRPARDLDVPALTGACAVSDFTTAALISDSKYGFRLSDNVLSITLINTACTPDPYSGRGIQTANVFIAFTDGNPTALKRKAEALVRPLVGVPTAHHTGILPAKASLLNVEAAHSVFTSAQIAQDGALTLRLYEAEGKIDNVSVRAPFTPVRAILTNLNGDEVSQAQIDGSTVFFPIEANRIVQVKLY